MEPLPDLSVFQECNVKYVTRDAGQRVLVSDGVIGAVTDAKIMVSCLCLRG